MLDGPDLHLHGGRLADGRVVDITVQDGVIVEVSDPRAGGPPPAEEMLDLTGFMVLPALAEPHVHLDKALTADHVRNPAGDLAGAIDAWNTYAAAMTVTDITARATTAVRRLVGNGATAIRTHVDVTRVTGLRGVQALADVRDAMARMVDIQIVALNGSPLTGEDGAAQRELAQVAIGAGADVVGGCPHLDDQPMEAMMFLLELARKADLPVDLHTDETLNPDTLGLRDLAEYVHRHPLREAVVASHCVSLGVQSAQVQTQVAKLLAAARIAVVANPQTNLFLQARGLSQSPPRAVAPLRTLARAGVLVAAGGDNFQDPFNLMGRGDPLEIAALLVTAAHLQPEDAYAAVSTHARRVMGLPARTNLADLRPGDQADFIAVAGSSVREVIATAPADRMVFRRGCLVARTTSRIQFPDGQLTARETHLLRSRSAGGTPHD